MNRQVKTMFPLWALTFLACNENPQPQQNNASATDTPIASTMIPRSACYEKVSATDTVRLKVEIFENVVIGTIYYHLYEKDSNNGEFEGGFRGDTLVADYTFMSEGIRSTRQVAFLIKDSIAVEGYGPVKEQEGKMVFTGLQQLQFEGPELRKVPCETIHR